MRRKGRGGEEEQMENNRERGGPMRHPMKGPKTEYSSMTSSLISPRFVGTMQASILEKCFLKSSQDMKNTPSSSALSPLRDTTKSERGKRGQESGDEAK
jgi:hypothetical protein